jgi:DNA-binding HxlR family transcriptional regulator
MTTYEITNQQLFNAKVANINLDTVRGGWCGYVFMGCIDIVEKKGNCKIIHHSHDGEHAFNDFEEDYGFVLVKVEEI